MRLALAFLAALAAAGCLPVKPTPGCDPGRMDRPIDHSVNAYAQDCYACERARGCSTVGNQWCCAEQMCSECAPPLVNFGGAPDAGAADSQRPKQPAVLR